METYGCSKYSELFAETYPIAIDIEIEEDKIIFRYPPDDEFCREFITALFTSNGYAKQASDIQFLGSDKSFCVVYRTSADCGCGCKGPKKKTHVSAANLTKNISKNTCSKNKIFKTNLSLYDDIKSEMGGYGQFEDDEDAEEDCKAWCNYAFAAAQGWVGAKVGGPGKAAIAATILEKIKEKCYKCCDKGQFYKNCIAPFAENGNILAQIGRGVDPAND